MTLLEGLLWLTLNVYHEARSEPEIGQVAVAHVTINRAKDLNLSIEEVIKQPNQFSWIGKKKSYFPEDPQAFLKCLHSSYVALKTYDFTSGSTYYHLNEVTPLWAANLTYVDQFGSHKFYRK